MSRLTLIILFSYHYDIIKKTDFDYAISNEVMKEQENQPILSQRKKWDHLDYMLLVLGSLVKYGDALEVYLPSVITQKVSCELGVTSTQEGCLALIMYLILV